MRASTSMLASPARHHARGRRVAPTMPCLCLALAGLLVPTASASGSTPLDTFRCTPSPPARLYYPRAEAATASSSAPRESNARGAAAASTPSAGKLRADTGAVSTATALSSTGSASLASSSLISASSTPSATSSAAGSAASSTQVPANYSLPRAFDSTLGTAFSSTACPSFFQTFLADPTFIACAPFSLLLSTSSAFFDAEKSPTVLLPYVLAATCAPAAEECTAKMAALATEVRLQSTCGPDLTLGNALAVEALEGFQNYELMRQAGCQRNNSTGQYCFAEAAAQSTPSELYFYYLSSGTSLPSGTIATCGGCTQGLMSLYAGYATNSSLAISKTYAAARVVVSTACGPTFAPVIATAISSATSIVHPLAGSALFLSLLLGAFL